jgi:NifU-like protein involved in Fe-S cluster formation
VVSPELRHAAERATGAGRLEDALSGRAEHPICGDELAVDVHVREGVIAALAWRARGCPATLAVAGCLHDAWVGVAVDAAAGALRARLGSGLAAHERHAEKLALRALEQALSGGAR